MAKPINHYARQVDIYLTAFSSLKRTGELSKQVEQFVNNAKSTLGKDDILLSQELSRIYTQAKLPEDVLQKAAIVVHNKPQVAEPIDGMEPLEPDDEIYKSVLEMHKAINLLRKNKRINARQEAQFKLISDKYKKEGRLIICDNYYEELSKFMSQFPNFDQEVKAAEKKIDTQKKEPEQKKTSLTHSQVASAPGLQMWKYKEDDQKLISAYITYLEKLTGKKISFQ